MPLGVPAAEALGAWLAEGRPALVTAESGPALLLGTRGRRLDVRQARTVVHQTVAAVNGAPDIGPHGLRHAVATHLLSGGFSLKEVGDHLGHASTESTQIYAKVNLPALREVAALDLKDVIRHFERCERKSTPVYRRGDPVALREVARISLEGLA